MSKQLDNASLRQKIQDPTRTFFKRLTAWLEDEFGVQGSFIGSGDAGELFNLSCFCFLIEALGIALGTDIDGRVAIHFEKSSFRDKLSCEIAIGTVRRYEGCHRDDIRFGK